jgi:hypothetical protein
MVCVLYMACISVTLVHNTKQAYKIEIANFIEKSWLPNK